MTEQEFEDYMRRHGWRGCNLVNPLCPDDLCVLPASHRGPHQLMTDIEPGPHWKGIKRCARLKGATAGELVVEGCLRASVIDREIES